MSKYEVYERLFKNNSMESIEEFSYFNFIHGKHYKPFNCALIMAQRPGAIFVQTENAWNKMGCELKPEANPIVIMQVGGPVTLVYDMEDVYSVNEQFAEFKKAEAKPGDRIKLNEYTVQEWVTRVNKKEIRVAFSRMGERRSGKAETLNSPIQVIYTEFVKGVQKEKSVMTNHQITINENLSPHEKVLTLFHELGHIYCGHFNGKCTKENGIPVYRFGREDAELERLSEEKQKLNEQMLNIEYNGNDTPENNKKSKEYIKLAETYADFEKLEKDLSHKMFCKQEYEAQLVCKILCDRNNFADDISAEYLKAHTVNGLLPDIDIYSVMDAVEKIAGILQI